MNSLNEIQCHTVGTTAAWALPPPRVCQLINKRSKHNQQACVYTHVQIILYVSFCCMFHSCNSQLPHMWIWWHICNVLETKSWARETLQAVETSLGMAEFMAGLMILKVFSNLKDSKTLLPFWMCNDYYWRLPPSIIQSNDFLTGFFARKETQGKRENWKGKMMREKQLQM